MLENNLKAPRGTRFGPSQISNLSFTPTESTCHKDAQKRKIVETCKFLELHVHTKQKHFICGILVMHTNIWTSSETFLEQCSSLLHFQHSSLHNLHCVSLEAPYCWTLWCQSAVGRSPLIRILIAVNHKYTSCCSVFLFLSFFSKLNLDIDILDKTVSATNKQRPALSSWTKCNFCC